MATTAQSTTRLIFRIGRVACAVPAVAVETIVLPPQQLTALPGSDAGRPGLFRHSRETVAAIDLRYRFGLHEADHRSGRLLLGRVGPSLCGFWVDSIIDMVDSQELAPTTLPPELPHNVFTAALLYRKEIVLCTDLNRLHAMRDAGATLQRMARPEPAPEPPREAEHAPAQARGASAVRTPPREAPTSATSATAKAATPTTEIAVRSVPPDTAHAVAARTNAAERVTATARTARPTIDSRPAAPRPVPSTESHGDHHKTMSPLRSERTSGPTPHTTAAPLHSPHTTNGSNPRPEPEPTTPAWQDEVSYPSYTMPQQTTNHAPWGLLLLLVLLLAGGGGTWYLLTQEPERPVAQHATLPTQPEPVVPVTTPVVTTPVVVPEPPPVASKPPETTTLVSAAGIAVQKDREGITIVIDRAAPASADTNAAAHVTPEAMTTADASAVTATPAAADVSPTPAATGTAKALTPPPVNAEPKPQQMYVHTVVKGDTLWDIAEHYLDDPWRYKDLAQLSRIKNPDLIYPGDKIRIIIR